MPRILCCGLSWGVSQSLLCCHNSSLFFHKHHKPRLGCLWSWNISTRLRLHSDIVSTDWDWVTEQRDTYYSLTQAEEKVVPTNRVSFRQDLSSLVTFHCVPVNDIHYRKWLKYQKYRYFDWRTDCRVKDLISEVSIFQYRSAHQSFRGHILI